MILDMCLEGFSLQAIAEKACISIVQLKNIRNSPCFQHELAQKRSKLDETKIILLARSEIDRSNNAKQILDDHQHKAAQKLVDKMEAGDNNLQVRCAESILDRTGLPKVAAVISENRNINVNISSEDVDRLCSTMELDK